MIELPTAQATQALGRAFGATLRAGDVVVLIGGLGAGKTTFTQGLAEGLGVRGPITSPTFVISRVHPSLVGGPALVHVDAYRLGGRAEVDDLDLDATVGQSVTVVEWGTGLVEQLADSWLELTFDREGTGPADTDTDTGPDTDAGGAPDEADSAGLRRLQVAAAGPLWETPEGAARLAGIRAALGLAGG